MSALASCIVFRRRRLAVEIRGETIVADRRLVGDRKEFHGARSNGPRADGNSASF
jgi:hypothetical protein